MAYQTNQLYASRTLAAFKSYVPRRIIPITVAAHSGAPVIPALTPMGLDPATDHWKVWNNADTPSGTGTIKGFLDPSSSKEHEDPDTGGLKTSASEEVIATLLVEGDFRYSDIPLPSGESQNDLDAALKLLHANNNNLRIQGLAGAY